MTFVACQYRYTIKLIVTDPETGKRRQCGILHRERQVSKPSILQCSDSHIDRLQSAYSAEPPKEDMEAAEELRALMGLSV